MKGKPGMHTFSSPPSFALYWGLKEAFFIQSEICNEMLTSGKGFVGDVKK